MACTDFLEPRLPAGAVPMTPPPEYAMWWLLTERCSGVRGDLSVVRWYQVPGTDTLSYKEAAGVTAPEIPLIAIAGDWIRSGEIVRHEMLHALIGGPGHPAAYFQQKCAGVVRCTGPCITDGGPLPPVDSTGPIVTINDTELEAYTDPAVPTAIDGWVAITVEIRNPHPYPVRVRLAPRIPGRNIAATIGLAGQFCDGSAGLNAPQYGLSDTLMVMGAAEVRRQVFDIHLLPICYAYQPFFNERYLPAIQYGTTP